MLADLKYNSLDTPLYYAVWKHQHHTSNTEKPGNSKFHYSKQFQFSVQVLFTCMTECIQAEEHYGDSASESVTTTVCSRRTLFNIHSLTVLKSYEESLDVNLKKKEKKKNQNVN